MRRERKVLSAMILALVACSLDPIAFAPDHALAVQRIALEAGLADQRRHTPSASITLDQRSVPRWAGRPGSPAALEPVARSLGIGVSGPGDSGKCIEYGGSPVCGLDRYRVVMAVAAARLEGKSATVEVFSFYRSESPPDGLSMGIAEYSLRMMNGRWQVVEIWLTAQ